MANLWILRKLKWPTQVLKWPEILRSFGRYLIDETHVAEAKVVLLGKDGVPASNRDATDLIDLPYVSSVSARSSFMESSGSRNQPTFA